ncbi:MAG TPA: phosphotransferase [Vicinamibacterales bacterium]|jgi:hypothetical protein|nr:phosphotransferase [Vicinamibacterales bacterium]
MSETTVNTSVARASEADWRFLLPVGADRLDHLVLMGGSPDLEATLVELGVARRITRTPRHGDTADAVVVLAGARESFEAAAQYVGPGGVLYAEVDRRARQNWSLTPGRASRRMRRLGLNPTTAYWVKPDFTDRQMYLPLDALGAFRWYLDTLYRSRMVGSRGEPTTGHWVDGQLSRTVRAPLTAALRALAAHRNGLSAFAPCFAITAVRGDARLPAVIERARLEGVPTGDATVHVLLAHGRTEWNRIVFLLFDPDGSTPRAAVKIPRLTTFNEPNEWEHTMLHELGSTLGPSLRSSIPASTLFWWNDLAVSAQTCVTGSSLDSRAGAGRAFEDLRLTAEWLAAFHQETTVGRMPARAWLRERLVNHLCTEYAATYGLTSAEATLFDTLSRCVDAVGTDTVPIVWQHGDLWPPNVYRDRSRVGVIDWETARRGPALVDLLSFVTHWAAAVDAKHTHASRLAHFQMLFCTGSAASSFVRAVHAEVAEYMTRVEILPSLLPFLLVYTFLEKALEDPRRRARLTGVHAGNRRENLEAGYVGVLASHAEALFAGRTFHGV